ncbi:AGAP004198-PA-like protein [Anopheles sinensis]|uniref:AGAP004198-PA-like protein n=1 Tax=Anopheles sinensis TaxID=74873 RepID=A0A084VNR7_ANOSI|nr:AGAP004198-PA-like protein [Anopheles sinensis]
MWHFKDSKFSTISLMLVTVVTFRAASAQFYSLSFGTDESYVTPVQSGPSGPIQQPQQQQQQAQAIRQKVTALDAMIDKTNHLGFRVLHQHSKGNKNNIAFSPCALGSTLVALYEGASGRSAAELHEQLVVPYDKDVLREGYRDIHRRLRSYFYQKENLLNGLSLSSENITIRPEYETVLKFYGYDLENIPEMRMQTTTTPLPSTTTIGLETEDTTLDSTTDGELATNTTESMDTTLASTTVETTTTAGMEEETTTEDGSGDTTDNESTDASTVPQTTEETTTESETTGDTTSEAPTTVQGETTESNGDEAGGEKRRRNLRKRGQRRGNPDSPQRRRSLRLKRQPEEIDIISHQRFLQNFLLQDVTTEAPPLHATASFLPGLGSSFVSQSDSYRLLDDTIEHKFYLPDSEYVRVPYKVYNTILKYAYIERLQSTVIELELDSEHYKLLLILPDYEFGHGNVLKLLQIGENVPNLRDITAQMSPTWVKTIVPKFSLKGNIILTSDLQNLGINDIFEPSWANFSLMTEDPTVYAKHIEQSININIRTHSLQQLKRFTSLYTKPIELAVNYPFLFCILDNELDLALMVGRILNPLNSRIH